MYYCVSCVLLLQRFPDLTSVPDAVQFGLADALSMCDKPLEAFNILKNFHSRQVSASHNV